MIYITHLCGSQHTDSGVFQGDSRGISFGLCTDGVNPFSHLRCTYSMWPIDLTLLNLPRSIHHEFRNVFMVGIVPSNGKKEANSIHPYLEVLVDELISLSNKKMFDAYQEANFNLRFCCMSLIILVWERFSMFMALGLTKDACGVTLKVRKIFCSLVHCQEVR